MKTDIKTFKIKLDKRYKKTKEITEASYILYDNIYKITQTTTTLNIAKEIWEETKRKMQLRINKIKNTKYIQTFKIKSKFIKKIKGNNIITKNIKLKMPGDIYIGQFIIDIDTLEIKSLRNNFPLRHWFKVGRKTQVCYGTWGSNIAELQETEKYTELVNTLITILQTTNSENGYYYLTPQLMSAIISRNYRYKIIEYKNKEYIITAIRPNTYNINHESDFVIANTGYGSYTLTITIKDTKTTETKEINIKELDNIKIKNKQLTLKEISNILY